MSTPRLSVLIPTLTRRASFLATLQYHLGRCGQQYLEQTEILINKDNGEKSIGKKRNELMQQARGEYVCFIDDDDDIPTTYLEKIFTGIATVVDHIGITMLYSRDGADEEIIKHSIGHVWEKKGGIIYRSATHLCAIKREIAIQVKFPDKSFGEDKEWAELINPLLRSEYLVEEVIYYYNYRSNKNGI